MEAFALEMVVSIAVLRLLMLKVVVVFIFGLGLSRALFRCCVEPDTEDNDVFQSCKPGSIFKLDSTLLS